jgi:hypothetical protein
MGTPPNKQVLDMEKDVSDGTMGRTAVFQEQMVEKNTEFPSNHSSDARIQPRMIDPLSNSGPWHPLLKVTLDLAAWKHFRKEVKGEVINRRRSNGRRACGKEANKRRLIRGRVGKNGE